MTEDGVPAGPILDDLGVRLGIDDTDRVVEVLVLAKTLDLESGEVGLAMAHNGIDWIAKSGLLAAAQFVMSQAEVEPGN
jgi:hypothetical protein